MARKNKKNEKASEVNRLEKKSKTEVVSDKKDFGYFLEKFIRSFASYPTNISKDNYTIALLRQGKLSYDVMLRMYERNSLVRMVVDTKTKILAGLDWDIIPEVGREDLVSEETINLAREFFNKPNEDDSWYSFIVKILTDLFIYDASCFEIVRDSNGEIIELVPVDASTILPIVDEHGRIIEYVQLVNRQQLPYGIKYTSLDVKDYVRFSKNDLVYFNEYPSTNRVFGRSPLEGLVIEIAADLYALGFNASWFTEGFWFTKILATPRLDDEGRERLVTMFDMTKGKPKELPIIECDNPDQVKILDLGFKNRDMEFSEFERWLFNRICGVYQINPNDIIQFKEYTTRASAEKQKEIADSKGFRPLVKLLEQIFTKIVKERFSPYLVFDIVPERMTEEQKLNILEKKYGKIPYNWILREMKMQPIELKINLGGKLINPYDYPPDLLDTYSKVLQLQEFERKQTATEIEPIEREYEVEKIKKLKKITKKIFDYKGIDREEFDKNLAEKLKSVFEEVKSTLKKKLRERPIPELSEGVVVKQDQYDIYAEEIALETILDSEFQKRFEEIMKENLKKVIKESSEQTLSQIGVSFDKKFWDRVAENYFKNRFYSKGILYDIVGTTKEQLTRIISSQYREGGTIKEIQEAIEKAVDEAVDWAAERIARTESMIAETIGMMDTWRSLGVNKWELKVYPESCPLCKAIAFGGSPSKYGKWSGEDIEFHGNPYTDKEREDLAAITGFDDFLPHPNCRDVWLPYIEDKKEEQKVLRNARRLQAELLGV